MKELFSSGGGLNSAAMSALICMGQLPRPDFIVIADTEREMPTTWQYQEAVVIPAFKKIGLEVHRPKKSDYGEPGCLGDYSKRGEGDLLMPVFTNQTGNASKMSAFCSDKWKQVVVNNFLSREFGVTASQYRKWLGYSWDEPKRWRKKMESDAYKKGLLWFPLVTEIRLSRHECPAIVEKAGWPAAPRSRCYDCPNQSDYEWKQVQDSFPDLFADAIKRDDAFRQRDPNVFLHSTYKPLKDVDLSGVDDMFSGSCPDGECFL